MRKFYSGILLVFGFLIGQLALGQTCAVSTTNPAPTPAIPATSIAVNASSGFYTVGTNVALVTGNIANFNTNAAQATDRLASPVFFYSTAQTAVYFRVHLDADHPSQNSTVTAYSISIFTGSGTQAFTCSQTSGGILPITVTPAGTDYYFTISGVSLPANTNFRIRLGLTVDSRDLNVTAFQSNATPAPAGTTLPAKLDNFDAASAGTGIKLSWLSSDEVGVAKYDIERSTNGSSFQLIGSVAAENKKNYSFVDNLPTSSSNYYRLRIVDADGRAKISHIVSVRAKAVLGIETFPNPVRDRLLVQHPKATKGTKLQLMNVQGQLVRSVEVPTNAVATPVDMSSLRAGAYYIIFKSTTETFSQRIVKE